jgi:hypothetical protein
MALTSPDPILPSLSNRADPGRPDGVEVAVLGPVEVRGAARPFVRARSLDLVVYLAMHPRGATNDGWATALWPDRVMAPPTLHSTASAARRSLGRSSVGQDHLPRGHGRLRLSDSVTTDWIRLRALAERTEPEAWRQALDLVRGTPFGGLRNADWTILDGFSAEIEEAVVELALRLGDHQLSRDDGPGATRTARRALRATPHDERLYRLLLLAADAQGNAIAVESVMNELLWVSGCGDEVGNAAGLPPGNGAPTWVHPVTTALYRSLSRRPHPATGRPLARL